MNKNKNGYCPSEGVIELRQTLAKDVGEKRFTNYGINNVVVQPGESQLYGNFLLQL